ncbi:uncharacterized protein LOC143286379 [Babylonia areolata]|uniref:uncharacterized protein LOC143286379 n=1 Tax=Babylonia areolata TaxID=304850 RepID=UPI003FD6A2E9
MHSHRHSHRARMRLTDLLPFPRRVRHVLPVSGFLLVVLLLHLTPTAADGEVVSAVAASAPCSHPSSLEAAHAVVLHNSSGRGALDCVSSCLRHSMCTAVAHVQRNDVTSAAVSCVLLGGFSGSPTTVSEDPSVETCTMHVLNRCPKGVPQLRGFCHCPLGTTGQFCQLTSPEDCAASWNRVHSSTGTPSNANEYIQAHKGNKAPSYKVALDNGDGSVIVLDGMYFFSDSSTTFASQVAPTLSRKSREEFDDFPSLEFRFVRSGGKVETFMDNSTSKVLKTAASDWFMRQPTVSRHLYAYGSTGNPTHGSLADVIQAVQSGQAMVSYDAVHVPSGTSTVQLSRHHWELGRTGYSFKSHPYWIDSLRATDGIYLANRFGVVGDSFLSGSVMTAGNNLYVDICWTSSHHPRAGSPPSSNNMGYLVAAVLNGHPVRTTVDGIHSLTVDQVLVQGQVLLFGTRAFLNPGNSFATSNAEEIRMDVSTDGQMFKCRNLPGSGSPMTSTTSQANVTWYVSTRQRSRVYSVTSAGQVVHGSEGALQTAVERGASVTVGVTFSRHAGHFLLVAVRSLELHGGASPAVVVMAEGLSRLPLPIGLVTSPQECGLRAILLTSQGKVRVYDYLHKAQGTHVELTDVTIDWFVDSYADSN